MSPRAKFTTWLFTITRNLVFNEMRRRSRKREVSLEEQVEEHHRDHAAPDRHNPDAAVAAERTRSWPSTAPSSRSRRSNGSP